MDHIPKAHSFAERREGELWRNRDRTAEMRSQNG